jgi:hypothetical protein
MLTMRSATFYQPPTTQVRVDPPLRPKQSQGLDIGFLNFFISTKPVDLSKIPQVSPFESKARQLYQP